MPFVIVGTLLVLLKLLEVNPVAGWSWLWILAPFLGAVIWWAWADSTGLTQRRAMKRLEERKIERRERDMAALGLKVDSKRRGRAARKAAEVARSREQGPKG